MASRFIDLPAEIRLNVYRHVFEDLSCIKWRPVAVTLKRIRAKDAPGVLFVSKFVYNEVHPLLLGIVSDKLVDISSLISNPQKTGNIFFADQILPTLKHLQIDSLALQNKEWRLPVLPQLLSIEIDGKGNWRYGYDFGGHDTEVDEKGKLTSQGISFIQDNIDRLCGVEDYRSPKISRGRITEGMFGHWKSHQMSYSLVLVSSMTDGWEYSWVRSLPDVLLRS